MTDKEFRARMIEAHVALNGATVCPAGSAIRGPYKTPFWRRRGSKGSKSARSPFFVRGEGCV